MAATRGRTVGAILAQLRIARPIRKADLVLGDQLLVKTENSVYSITVMDGSVYSVQGGWFDRHGLSPIQTAIAGCSWGGSVIKVDIVAALGLSLEFGNRVRTSPIRSVLLVRSGDREGRRLCSFDIRLHLLACYGLDWETAAAA